MSESRDPLVSPWQGEDEDRKEVVGWYEYVEFPAWGIPGLKAKLDTGARTSALHVDGIAMQGNGMVRFDVVLHRKHAERRVSVEAEVLRRSRVRSSSGSYRTRYVVPALIRLGDVEKIIEVSLVSRDKMLFRMLLGRSAFSGEFLIDAARHCLLGQPPRSLAPPAPPHLGATKKRKSARRTKARLPPKAPGRAKAGSRAKPRKKRS